MNSIAIVGEDQLSSVVCCACIRYALPKWEIYDWRPSQGGRDKLVSNLPRYLKTAKHQKILLQIDLDNWECPPSLRRQLLEKAKIQELPSNLLLSIARRETEAWILGDFEQLTKFLCVRDARPIADPESHANPKDLIVSLARRSRYKSEICPEEGMTSKVGSGYNSRLSEFVRTRWRAESAADSCPTLRRLLSRLRAIGEQG